MLAVISDLSIYEKVERNIFLEDIGIIYKSENSNVDILQELERISRLPVKHLIIQLAVLENIKELPAALRKYKIRNSAIQIILIAPDILPGNKELSLAVGMAIYDILSLSFDEMDNIDKEIEKSIKNPARYEKAVKWDIGYIEETKEKEIKEKIVKVEKFSFMKKSTVAFASLTPCSGSSFLALNLAKAASSFINTSLIEIGNKNVSFYCDLDIKNKFENYNKEFVFYHDKLKNSSFNGEIGNELENIHYIVMDPQIKSGEEWSNIDTLTLLNHCRNISCNVVDLNTLDDVDINIFDLIFLVIDPSPTNIHRAKKDIEKYKEFKNAKFIINKFSKEINSRKKEILEFIEVEPLFLPFIEGDHIYEIFYKDRYEDTQEKFLRSKDFNKILKMIIPEEIIKSKTKKKKAAFSFWNKKKELKEGDYEETEF